MEPLVTSVTLSRDHVSDADRRSRSSCPWRTSRPTGVGRQWGTGDLDKAPGYFLRVCVADRGEPGKGNDTMRMQPFAPGPVLVYDSATDFADEAPGSACDGHRLDGGNAQIHSGLKE